MTALSPTRVSIYDFLIEDTLQIDSIFADSGNISIPQARLVIENGIQAITSGLLAYEKRCGSSAILKKIFNRFQINELRKYYAFNLITMEAVKNFGYQNLDILFEDKDVQKRICKKIAAVSSLESKQVRPLLGRLTTICIRELAIIIDFAQLDHSEINNWFNLQSQFLKLERSNHTSLSYNDNTQAEFCKITPKFDLSWHQITGYKPIETGNNLSEQQIPNYAKVIGRISSPSESSAPPKEQPDNSNDQQLIVDTSNNSDILSFSHIDNITLPYQRWLLQLAKVAEIYLQRRRLKIAPEPNKKPDKLLVNLKFLERQTPKTNSTNIKNKNTNLLRNNTILVIMIIIIGLLTLMAFAKFYYKKTINTKYIKQSNTTTIKS